METLKYPLSVRILHWLMAGIIISLLAVGLIMADMSHDNPLRPLLFSLHKSFGVSIILLALLRLAIRLRHKAPPLPGAIPAYERLLARYGHWGFYLFMFAMPVSGYLLSSYYGLPVQWFGLNVPRLVDIDRVKGGLAGDFHAYAAYTLMALIALHIAGVIKHYVKERINLLTRMW